MRNFAKYLTIVLLLICLDQATKAVAVAYLPEFGTTFSTPDPLISFGVIYHEEPEDYRIPVGVLGILLLFYLWSLRLPMPSLVLWSGGGLSNIFEFFLNGRVVDFVGIREQGGYLVWNIADLMILTGFLILVICALFGKIRARDFIMGSRFMTPTDWGDTPPDDGVSGT